MAAFDGDVPLFISHISSGELAEPGDDFNTGKEWCDEVPIDPGEQGNEEGTEPIKDGVCGNSWTPAGVYSFDRKVEGHGAKSRLGGMQNPVYFNYGIAIHGAYQVPLEPASHGCIRIPNLISPTFFNLVNTGEQVFVFDDEKEPEEYGSPSGLWDWKDPNYTTTTTTSTTTTTLPSAPRPTTVPAAAPARDDPRPSPRRPAAPPAAPPPTGP